VGEIFQSVSHVVWQKKRVPNFPNR
jgi:hypothetical protein